MSLGKKIGLLFIFVTLVISLVSMSFQYYENKKILENEIKEKLSTLIYSTGLHIDILLKNYKNDTIHFSSHNTFYNLLKSQKKNLVE